MITDIFARNEVSLGSIRQIPPGEGRNFEVQGKRIAVFHTRSGEVFATQAECPHRVGPLSDGLVGNATLICPLHAWKFDLRTGEALYGNCGLTTYPVRRTAEGELVLTLALERE